MDRKFRELITGAFDNEANTNANMVCKQIADGTKDVFGAVENGNTYMVAILNKETFDNLQND